MGMNTVNRSCPFRAPFSAYLEGAAANRFER